MNLGNSITLELFALIKQKLEVEYEVNEEFQKRNGSLSTTVMTQLQEIANK